MTAQDKREGATRMSTPQKIAGKLRKRADIIEDVPGMLLPSEKKMVVLLSDGAICIERQSVRIAVLEKALQFYANLIRYNGSNQPYEAGATWDPFTPPGFPYVINVDRDRGKRARAALAQKGAQT